MPIKAMNIKGESRDMLIKIMNRQEQAGYANGDNE